MSKEAMKLALEALEGIHPGNMTPMAEEYWNKAITALREALVEQTAQPQQEPIAYAVYHRMGGSKSLHWPEQHSPNGDVNEYQLVPLYTSPPAQRTWVELTDEEKFKVADVSDCFEDVVDATEAKLKEKNT